MRRVFDGAFDVGGGNLPFDDTDQASVERMMGQQHVFCQGMVRFRLRFR